MEKYGRKNEYILSSVSHSLQVLDLLMVRDGLRLKDITDILGLDRSSAFKILYTLNYRGFVFKDDHFRYHLGGKLAPCKQISETRHNISEIAKPYIVQLWARTQKTVLLGVLGLDSKLTIASIKTEPNQDSIVGRIGAGMDIHTTGLGKILLAFQEPNFRKTIVEHCRFEKRTEKTITDPQAFLDLLSICEKQKWAASYEENRPGHCDLAAPIFDYSGACVAALSIVSDRSSMDSYRPLYLKHLQDAAHQISELLGYNSYLK